MENDECVKFVPFSHYDWTFARSGWLPWNPTAFALIASFCAVAYWMCIELLILVYVTFKRHSGTYFYFIVITILGLVLQTTGYLLKIFENACPAILVTVICKLGWVMNVTGFSIVLWSRLHLVVYSPRILRAVLIMIITNAVVCHIPIIVFEFGLMSRHHSTYYQPMQITERIQQTIFSLQETIISSLYIYHTARFLSAGYATHTRKVICLLLCVQVTVVALDAVLTVFDYTDKFTLKCTVHPFIYSIKLKMEFIVLNQLQTLVKRGLAPGLSLGSNIAVSDSSSTTPPTMPAQSGRTSEKTVAEFNRDPMTKIRIVSPSASLAATENSDGRPTHGHKRMDSEGTTLSGEELDLKNIVGRPDDDEITNARANDIERMYLGRWIGQGV